MRPKLEIAPIIVEDPSIQDCYRIKIINRSRRAVVDISCELVIMRPERTKGGVIKMRKVVPVSGASPLIIPGRKKGNDDGNMYRIRANANLRGILEEDGNRYVRLRVFGRDEVSGVGRVVEREYHDPSAEIATGKYVKGPTFEII